MGKSPAHVKLKKWRTNAGLTSVQAAERAGVSLWTWSQLENGHGAVKRLQAMGLETLTGGAVVACDWK